MGLLRCRVSDNYRFGKAYNLGTHTRGQGKYYDKSFHMLQEVNAIAVDLLLLYVLNGPTAPL